jgi:hypothetical protein
VAIRLVLLPQNAILLPRSPPLWLLMEKNTKNKKKKQKNEIKVACYPIFLLTLQKQEKVLPIP